MSVLRTCICSCLHSVSRWSNKARCSHFFLSAMARSHEWKQLQLKYKYLICKQCREIISLSFPPITIGFRKLTNIQVWWSKTLSSSHNAPHSGHWKVLKIYFRRRFEKILNKKKTFQNVNENEYAANLREQCWFCSDISCKHSEDTPEVAFAYHGLFDFRASESRQRIKHL